MAVTVEELFEAALHFGCRTGVEERMPEELDLPSACSQRRAQNRLTLENIGGVLVERSVIEQE